MQLLVAKWDEGSDGKKLHSRGIVSMKGHEESGVYQMDVWCWSVSTSWTVPQGVLHNQAQDKEYQLLHQGS